MTARRLASTGFALTPFVGIAVAVCLDCNIPEPLPPHFPIPSPWGHAVAVPCDNGGAGPGPATVLAPVPFDRDLKSWPERSGAFGSGGPIASPTIRAQDVVVHRNADQLSLLEESARTRSSAIVPIGGDYWRDTPYPIGGASSGAWVSSGFKAGAPGTLPERVDDKLVGIMTSVPFPLAGGYLREFVGGDEDSAVGVELLVKAAAGNDLSACDGARGSPRDEGRPPGFVVARVRRGGGGEQLMPIEIPLDAPGCDLRGLTAILRIFDRSPSAHVNVGTFGLTDRRLTEAEADVPIWGFADYHTHPTDYLSFGGLQGIHSIWGAPGGSMHEYVGDAASRRRSFARDIPDCDESSLPFNAHHGGPAAPIMVNAAEGRLTASAADLGLPGIAFDHGSQGGPSFKDFPDFRAGAHEQYHVSQIHRAYLGGLRLMTALAVHNRGLEYGAGWVRCGENGNPTVDTTPDWTVIRAHARAIKQLAYLNRDWMEIAYSPSDARRIIRENKLALVLGTEVPQLGLDADGDPAEQVQKLEALGIRQVILVHGMDNLLAGTAVFEDLYNSVNDWMNRPPQFRDKVESLSGEFVWGQYPASFYEITTAPSPPVTSLPGGGPIEGTEPIQFRLGIPQRVVLSDIYPKPPNYPFLGDRFGLMHTLVSTTPMFETPRGPYDTLVGGHRNVRGLSGRGAEFIQRLMQRGMLVDLAHMSDATLAATYDVTSNACSGYPLMVSHAHFRPLQLKVDDSDLGARFVKATGDRVRQDIAANRPPVSACVRDRTKCDGVVLQQAEAFASQATKPGTTDRDSLPREYDIASSEIQQVRVRGGAVGVFIGQGTLDPSAFDAASLPGGLTSLPIPLNCAGSSQGVGAALLFASARMKGTGGIGLASDFTFVSGVAPRFGASACAGYLGTGASSASGAQLLETLINPSQYAFDQQGDGVNYASPGASCANGRSTTPDVRCGSNAPLDPDVMGDRMYDFNVDGLAQYGLLPDVLQDVANQLHGARHLALDNVFASANAYIEMWSTARRLSRCEATGLCTTPSRDPDPQCLGRPVEHPECGYSCPCGWNHGAPLQLVQERTVVCDPGERITLPVVDSAAPHPTRLVYQQRRADPSDSGDLAAQGDWAVYRIQPKQKWRCGGSGPRDLGCPGGANFVKLRRILDTTVSRFTDRCDYQPLPPEDGNRSVLVQCLAGSVDDPEPRTRP